MVGTTVRSLTTIEACREVVALQQAVWGFGEREVVPAHVLLTAADHGGLVLGAFEGSTMVGMVFGFAGLRPDGRIEHVSHMAGVVREAQGRGVGSALKWSQREYVLAQGIDIATWTFDPCEARNATFNLRHLGALARTYRVDLYGELGDDLNRGLPSDRLQVEWLLASRRVRARSERGRVGAAATGDAGAVDARRGTGTSASSVRSSGPLSNEDEDVEDVITAATRGDALRVPRAWKAPTAGRCRIEIPASMQRLKADDPPLALEWRLFVREALSAALAAGYVATDVAPRGFGPDERGPAYILEHRDRVDAPPDEAAPPEAERGERRS